MPFDVWCTKIATILQKGQTFKKEVTLEDKYLLLPAFWHGTLPEEKKKIFNMINEEDGNFSSQCISKLHSECHIRIADMQNLRVCYELAKEDPTQLDRHVPCPTDIRQATSVDGLSVEQEAGSKMKSITAGLNTFELKPANVKGIDLFDHMIKHRLRRTKEDSHGIIRQSRVCSALNIDVCHSQQSLVNPSEKDLVIGLIISSAGGDGARLKLPQRKLNSLGYINCESGCQNDEERLKRMKRQLQITASIVEIKEMTRMEEQEARDKDEKALHD